MVPQSGEPIHRGPKECWAKAEMRTGAPFALALKISSSSVAWMMIAARTVARNSF
jgi:hypothetical protein